jgi:hypothetical protein
MPRLRKTEPRPPGSGRTGRARGRGGPGPPETVVATSSNFVTRRTVGRAPPGPSAPGV